MTPKNMADFASWSDRDDLVRVVGRPVSRPFGEALEALEAVEVLAELLYVHEMEALGGDGGESLSPRQRVAVLTAIRALAARREEVEVAIGRELVELDDRPPEGRPR